MTDVNGRRTLFPLFAVCSAFVLVSCAPFSKHSRERNVSNNLLVREASYADSGTIVLSRAIPEPRESKVEPKVRYAPVIGYVPPSSAFVPADNETWLEIDRETHAATLFKGGKSAQHFSIEGSCELKPGTYPVQTKEKRPLWYAPDEYFVRRFMPVPGKNARLRYHRGAFGEYALFLGSTCSIHSAPLWTAEVGGLRIAPTELASIYHMLPVGSSVVIK